MDKVKFLSGTSNKFSALATKDAGTFYYLTDTKELYLGSEKISGEDGYTPVRGTDYWTEADKAEIKSYVDNAILGGEW